jgi:hypothetical protein
MAGREPIVFSSLTGSEIFIEVSSAAETKIEGDRRLAAIPGSSPAGGVIMRMAFIGTAPSPTRKSLQPLP